MPSPGRDRGPGEERERSPGEERASKRKATVSQARSYAYYSGIAIQMIVTLLLANYGGDWLMRTFGLESPLLKAGILLVGVGLALWLPLRGLTK